MHATSHKPCKMGHINHQIGTNAVGNIAEGFEIDDTRIGRATGDDELGLVLFGKTRDFIKINLVILRPHAILYGVEPLARLVRSGTMSQVATGSEAHAEDGVTRFDERHHRALISLRTGIRLHVDIGAVE